MSTECKTCIVGRFCVVLDAESDKCPVNKHVSDYTKGTEPFRNPYDDRDLVPKKPIFLREEIKSLWPILQDQIPFRKIILDKKELETNITEARFNRFKIELDEPSYPNERFDQNEFPSALKDALKRMGAENLFNKDTEVREEKCPIWSSVVLGRCPTTGQWCLAQRADCFALSFYSKLQTKINPPKTIQDI